jgi:anthranilate synthase/aminodeoxychorismate synthase-like glutamine amidotransferase
MILVIDNYDSFTYNLVQYLEELYPQVCPGDPAAVVNVLRNDAVDVEGVRRMAPRALVISPGPGDPTQAGISGALLAAFADRLPILGVCLGHQCLGHVMGGKVTRADRVMHGKTSPIHHDGKTLFAGLPDPFEATRYHSLIVRPEGLPERLEISARTAEGEIMGLRLRGTRTEGVQFHPESILTTWGKQLLRNFVAPLGAQPASPSS